MRIENDIKLDFKDVLIRPKRSTLASRSGVDVTRSFRFLHTGGEWSGFPLIAANMDVTGTLKMAAALGRFGALTALHKYIGVDDLAAFFNGPDGAHAFYSIGTNRADHEKFAVVKAQAPIAKICLDVANGYTETFIDMVKTVRDENPGATIMAGNVVTGDMTEALLLAGHDECEGELRHEQRNGVKTPVGMVFYGMSSEAAMQKHSGGVAAYRAAEGKSVEVPYRGPVDATMQEIMGGVRSMMTYIGAMRLKEVPKRTTFVRVSSQLNNVFGAG